MGDEEKPLIGEKSFGSDLKLLFENQKMNSEGLSVLIELLSKPEKLNIVHTPRKYVVDTNYDYFPDIDNAYKGQKFSFQVQTQAESAVLSKHKGPLPTSEEDAVYQVYMMSSAISSDETKLPKSVASDLLTKASTLHPLPVKDVRKRQDQLGMNKARIQRTETTGDLYERIHNSRIPQETKEHKLRDMSRMAQNMLHTRMVTSGVSIRKVWFDSDSSTVKYNSLAEFQMSEFVNGDRTVESVKPTRWKYGNRDTGSNHDMEIVEDEGKVETMEALADLVHKLVHQKY